MDLVLAQVATLPQDWHAEGSLENVTLEAIVRHAPTQVRHSVETGTGRSTLVLSHISKEHTVFALPQTSMKAVRESSILREEVCTFVEGPTQTTMRQHQFPALDLAILDGPHAYPFPELEYFMVYPHLQPGALLVIDDIHIPTIGHMWDILREDAMFDEIETVQTTGFLRRSDVPAFPSDGDGWEFQNYNTRRYPNRNVGLMMSRKLALKRKAPSAWNAARTVYRKVRPTAS
jgi:hypothetical protein